MEYICNFDETTSEPVGKEIIINDIREITFIKMALQKLRDEYQGIYDQTNHQDYGQGLPEDLEHLNNMLRELNNPKIGRAKNY